MAQCKALGKYLRRNNSFSRSRIKANLAFVSVLRLIIKLLSEPNVDALVRENLQVKIRRETPAYSTWLIQQLERL